jgi:pimeloyl-ACP methyl ester carboxylesterase
LLGGWRVRFVVLSALFVIAMYLAGVLAYAVGSFLLMRPHATARTLGLSVRELARETVLAAVTQPFLLLYYVVGRRMGPRLLSNVHPDGVPVVLVHGYMQNRVGFVGLARALARRGIGPLYGFNYPWFSSIGSNAKRLTHFVARVREETRAAYVDLVCHSMGGLVAIEMLSQAGQNAGVRRLVTIATPHAGVAWQGPLLGVDAESLRRGSKLLTTHAGNKLAVPALSIFSTHDNIVYPMETARLSGRGGKDVEVDGVGHLAILFSPEVADHVADFLREPAPAPAIVDIDDDHARDA